MFLDDDIVALRRSRLRCRILAVLHEHGPLGAHEIAAALDTRPLLVRWAMEGRLPHYAPERALRRLAIVRRTGRSYALTRKGRRLAKDLVARRWLYRLV